jgi:hypothetical protein
MLPRSEARNESFDQDLLAGVNDDAISAEGGDVD